MTKFFHAQFYVFQEGLCSVEKFDK